VLPCGEFEFFCNVIAPIGRHRILRYAILFRHGLHKFRKAVVCISFPSNLPQNLDGGMVLLPLPAIAVFLV